MPILLFSHTVLTPSENVIVHWSTLQWLHLKYTLKVNALHLETRLAIDSLSGFLTKAWKWSNYLLCVEMNCKPPWFTSFPNYYSSLYLQQQYFHPAYFFYFSVHFNKIKVGYRNTYLRRYWLRILLSSSGIEDYCRHCWAWKCLCLTPSCKHSLCQLERNKAPHLLNNVAYCEHTVPMLGSLQSLPTGSRVQVMVSALQLQALMGAGWDCSAKR